jgi:hypothetical protein
MADGRWSRYADEGCLTVARDSRVTLPEDGYLVLVGQVAYMVSSLEWTILGDLPGLAQYLPADLNAQKLAGRTTGEIGAALTAAINTIKDEEVRTYVEAAGRLLSEASDLRNDLLHARPATVGNVQRLYRWKLADRRGPGRALVIDTGWLESAIDALSAASVALNDTRPIHKNATIAGP